MSRGQHSEAESGRQDVLPEPVARKLDLMFDGVRYTDSLGQAATHAFPNWYPYRFAPGEPDPTGKGQARIPYLIVAPDGTTARIKGNGASPWYVAGDPASGYRLCHDGHADAPDFAFAPLPDWMARRTSDGVPMTATGVSLHRDMAVVNVAPGCQYFAKDPAEGRSLRCTFCTYGAPDARMEALGQALDRVGLPEVTYRRLQETLSAALDEGGIRHIYLVGGSMTDWHEEGERFVELARRVQETARGRVPVACGSGALPDDVLGRLHREGTVDNVCFNLEVWSKPLFAAVCPGKERYVGYERWIAALETAVGLWGRGHVYSAMVAGIELAPEHAMPWRGAADLAVAGADDLCRRGILPVYSLYWPFGGHDHPDGMADLKSYFTRLAIGTRAARVRHGLAISDGFMCHRCAYMQVECDMDRAAEAG
jgi:hypothetical protein